MTPERFETLFRRGLFGIVSVLELYVGVATVLTGKDVLLGLCFFTLGSCLGGYALLGLKPASSVAWGSRASLLMLACIVYLYHVGWRPIDWTAIVVAAGVGLVTQHIAHRYALGWIIDSRGERQKVTMWSRGLAIISPTTWNERIIKEARLKSARRWTLVWSTPVTLGLLYWAYRLYRPGEWAGSLVVGFVAALLMLIWVPNVIAEWLYLIGYQDMDGHKVLDPAPVRPGVEQVIGQKVHGDAPVASSDEARNLLNPRP